MAKYQIAHRCGHEVTMNLVGKTADRERRTKWEGERDCLECSRARELEAAKEANAGLPALEGSEKQVAWAETIRATLVGGIEEAMAGYRKIAEDAAAAGRTGPMHDEILAAIEAGVAAAKAEPAAKWWIDNQYSSGKAVVDAIVKREIVRIKGGA